MGSLVNHPFKGKRDCWIVVEASICCFIHKKKDWTNVRLGRENA